MYISTNAPMGERAYRLVSGKPARDGRGLFSCREGH